MTTGFYCAFSYCAKVSALSVQLLERMCCHWRWIGRIANDQNSTRQSAECWQSILTINAEDQKELGCDTVNRHFRRFRLQQWIFREDVADAVIIAAAAKTSNIVSEAANMCRKRGRVVVGSVGLDLNVRIFEKELTFQVSCSYGPGRYDLRHEEKGLDYLWNLSVGRNNEISKLS